MPVVKKNILALIVLISAVFAARDAFSENAPFATGPAPAQAYASVGNNSAQTASAPTAESVNPTSYLNSAGVDTSVRGEISRMTQEAITFEQQVNARIQNLTDSNQAIAVAIQNINQQSAQLQQQMKIMQMQQMAQTQSHANGWQQLIHSLAHEDVLVYFNITVAALFLMGFGVIMGRRFQGRPLAFSNSSLARKLNVNDPHADDTKTEYDFMGTREAIPAQLDLARSYIAMGDYIQAKTILKTIVDKGDKEQSLQATLLLDRMQHNRT